MIKRFFRQDEVATTANSTAYSQDRNKDGIPDYLQREQIRSLAKPIAETNLAEVDAKRELEALTMRWRGYVYDPNQSAYIPRSPPMINDSGINFISGHLETFINKITMTTSITEEYAHRVTLHSMRIINGWLADNRRKWEINFSDLSPISNQIESLIFFTLSKSVDDKQRKHVTERTRITETRSMPNMPPSSI